MKVFPSVWSGISRLKIVPIPGADRPTYTCQSISHHHHAPWRDLSGLVDRKTRESEGIAENSGATRVGELIKQLASPSAKAQMGRFDKNPGGRLLTCFGGLQIL